MCEPPRHPFLRTQGGGRANRAHAEAQKKKKDAKEARRNKKILKHEALEKRRRRQK